MNVVKRILRKGVTRLFHDISLEEMFDLQGKRELVVIDVRSPSEYKNATIPGSVNIPLFTDKERAEIGTLYTQTGKQPAKERGLQIVSAKLPEFVKKFEQIDCDKAVFCWRGGMRSRTTATVLSLMGIHTYRLGGGYREYRRWVAATLDSLEFRPEAYIIHGNTGTGKTALLHRLKQQGYPVLDLEAMAGHRGSIFGHIGLEANNQKTFDALLLQEVLQLQDSPFILLESESKRVGKVVLPELISTKIATGLPIWIEMPMQARVKQILEDYQPWDHREACLQAFKRIKSRIHIPIAKEIEAVMHDGQYEVAAELLLEHYYDPRYAHAHDKSKEIRGVTLSVQNLDEAVEAVQCYLDQETKRTENN